MDFKTNSIKLIALALFCIACRTEPKTNAVSEISTADTISIQSEEKSTHPLQDSVDSKYTPSSVNDELALKIEVYIKTKMLTANEINIIPAEQRKFQLYQTDLNGDGQNEILINFMTSYFCGSGGCTMVLLDHNFNEITNFSVMRTPVYAETTTKNEWRILLTRSQGELKALVFNNGTYPSNPSVVEKAPYDAPSGHAEIMFDDTFSPAKTYTF
ncbi:hypothetical protein [Formosa sp. S-31]|uniref:hypothetical protein n=1 Tax=Formosa sp. S-31 TaxID=2790949 RepID=UPI003EB888C0